MYQSIRDQNWLDASESLSELIYDWLKIVVKELHVNSLLGIYCLLKLIPETIKLFILIRDSLYWRMFLSLYYHVKAFCTPNSFFLSYPGKLNWVKLSHKVLVTNQSYLAWRRIAVCVQSFEKHLDANLKHIFLQFLTNLAVHCKL